MVIQLAIWKSKLIAKAKNLRDNLINFVLFLWKCIWFLRAIMVLHIRRDGYWFKLCAQNIRGDGYWFKLCAQNIPENKCNTMAVDALGPCVARSSATMVLDKQTNRPLSPVKKNFNCLRQRREIIKNDILVFQNEFNTEIESIAMIQWLLTPCFLHTHKIFLRVKRWCRYLWCYVKMSGSSWASDTSNKEFQLLHYLARRGTKLKFLVLWSVASLAGLILGLWPAN